jgi:hypothetical protein
MICVNFQLKTFQYHKPAQVRDKADIRPSVAAYASANWDPYCQRTAARMVWRSSSDGDAL